MVADRSLAGCRVVVTRPEPGELGRLLDDAGAEIVHVPLIEITEPTDGGAALGRELEHLDRYDWLVVTSPAGADRVGRAAAAVPTVELAAVGSATAERLSKLAQRPVDLVPDRQLAAVLAEEFCRRHAGGAAQRVLLAVADRADDTFRRRCATDGHEVVRVDAYRTVLRRPSDDDLTALHAADAVVFTSGSAAQGWAEALGGSAASRLPEHVVAIGPSTASAAAELGLKITAVAADHSLAGVVETLRRSWQSAGQA